MKFKFGDKMVAIEPQLQKRFDLMVRRVNGKRDAVILVDGNEGEGKSNIACLSGAYFSSATGRPFTVDNCFFDIKDMINFAKKGEKKIIWWDEGALGGLASDWWNKNQKLFITLLMIARKKQHIFIICVPKFYKLNEYIACDRSIALLHVYSADNLERGRFTYYNDAKKDVLYDNWKRKHKKTYRYGYNFHGKFSEHLPKLIDEDAYETKKDKAILEMGGIDMIPKKEKRLIQIEERILIHKKLDNEIRGELLGVKKKTIENKRTNLNLKSKEKDPIS